MRAMGFRTNGGPEVFTEVDVPEPVVGEEDVLIRVAYAGVNFAEIQHRRGEFGAVDGPGGIDVPGLEVSGRIEAVGPGVHGLKVGEEVLAYLPRFGGYADLVSTHHLFVAQIPERGTLDLATAGGLACVLPTAYGLINTAGRLRPDDAVLIHAAAGGVGSMAAQMARAIEADVVIGTVSTPDKIDYALGLGYDHVFLRSDFADGVLEVTEGRGVDLVLDPVGGPVRETSLKLLAPYGRVVVYGDAGRYEDWQTNVFDLWKHNRTITGFNIGDLVRRAPAVISGYTMLALDMMTSGVLRQHIDRVAPLAEVAEVHRLMESGVGVGKTLLRVNEI